jgi:hypothetical protein
MPLWPSKHLASMQQNMENAQRAGPVCVGGALLLFLPELRLGSRHVVAEC